MSTATLTVWLILAVLAGAGLGAIVIYNRLVRSQVRTREAWSGIDVQLKRRASLIPNLVEAVRGYASHERGVMEEVARARGALQGATGAEEASTANVELTRALGRLLAVAEAYPELRASDTFGRLLAELTDVEEKIAYARQFYNRNVADFNERIRSVPDVFVARGMGLPRFEFFAADDEGSADVRVRFGSPSTADPGSRG